MTLHVHQSGTQKAAAHFHVHSGGSLKTASRAHIRQGGALKQFYGQFSVALSSSDVVGYATSKTTVTVTTGSVSAIVTGGIGTLHYAWVAVGFAPGWTINSPSAATTTFSVSCAAGNDKTATFQCTVIDSTGQTLTTSSVSAECINDFAF